MSVVRLLICGVLELKALGQTFVGPVIWPLRTGRKCAYLFSRFVGANGNTSTRSYRSERKERESSISPRACPAPLFEGLEGANHPKHGVVFHQPSIWGARNAGAPSANCAD
eukprot:s10_g30.t1